MTSVIVSSAGTSGPRGNSVLNGQGPPTADTGIDGDWYIDNAIPSQRVMYGPKTAGAWGSGVAFGGGGGTAAGALLAVNNLSDVQDKAAARTSLGLGSAALAAAGAFDAAGAASSALGDAQRYTDEQLAGEVSRADAAYDQAGAASSALGSAKTYTDQQLAAEVTRAASAYDQAGAASSALGSAKTYTDQQLAGEVTRADSAYRRRQPWVFDITDPAYGAVGDAVIVTDGTVNVGVAVLTCATSRPFKPSDVDKVVLVQGAGTFGVTAWKTRLVTYNGPDSMGLADTPPVTVAGAITVFGTNNYNAIRAANQAAIDYRNAGHSYAQVYTPPVGGFILDGPLDTSMSGNGLVPFGVDPVTGPKKIPHYAGGADSGGAGVRHWGQTVPQVAGSTWISFSLYSSTSAQDANISANGHPGIICGPNEGTQNGLAYGVGTAQGARFSNTLPVVTDMAFLTPHSAFGLTQGALNFYGCATAHLRNVSVSTLGAVPSPSDYTSPGQFGSGLAAAVLMPAPGNNDLSIVDNLSVQGGFTYGIMFSEHTLITRIMVLYCWSGLVVVGTYAGSVGSVHEMRVLSASVEACTHEVYVMGPGSQGVGPTVDIHLSTESSTPNIFGSQASLMAAVGRLKLTGLFNKAGVSTAYPTGIEIVDGQAPSPIARKTAAFTCSPIDRVLLCDTTAGTFTATLPSADVNPVEYVLRNTGPNPLTVAAVGGQLIYPTGGTAGAATAAVASGSALRLRASYNGTAWAWYAV